MEVRGVRRSGVRPPGALHLLRAHQDDDPDDADHVAADEERYTGLLTSRPTP